MTPPPTRPDFPEIVAHRGDAEHFPENSLQGLEAAWRAGLRYAEFDVQLSADGVPYVIHDARLDRTTNTTGDLRFLPSDLLDGVDAGEPRRFGPQHAGTRLPRLVELAKRMASHADARAFVEIKRASIAHHGSEHCLERIFAALAGVLDRCIMISFDAETCRLARTMGGGPVGWVIEGEPVLRRDALETLRPEFAFCDHRRLPAAGPLPAGRWAWAAYEVTAAPLALALCARGVGFVESMAPLRLRSELADLRATVA